MKPYLITTALLFSIMTVLHVVRAASEWPHPMNGMFILEMALLVVLPAALAAWAWMLFARATQLVKGMKA